MPGDILESRSAIIRLIRSVGLYEAVYVEHIPWLQTTISKDLSIRGLRLLKLLELGRSINYISVLLFGAACRCANQ